MGAGVAALLELRASPFRSIMIVGLLLFALAWPASASAQQKIPSGVGADNAVRPSREPDSTSPPMTTLGYILPLQFDEKLVPFANQCAAVVDSKSQVYLVPGRESWFGPCRFGLAHGFGLRRFYNQSGLFEESVEFHYGRRIGGENRLVNVGGDTGLQSGVWTFIASPLTGESYLIEDRKFQPGPSSDKSQNKNLLVKSNRPDKFTSIQISSGEMRCGSIASNLFFSKFSAADQQRAKALCAKNPDTVAAIVTLQSSSVAQVGGLRAGKMAREEAHFLCASAKDCASAWAGATARVGPDIQRIRAQIEADEKAARQARNERFAPLEQGLAIWLRGK